MGSPRDILLPAANQVTAGKKSTFTLDPGWRYDVVTLEFGDSVGTLLGTGNILGDIKCLAFNKDQLVSSAIQLNALNARNNEPGSARFSLKTTGTPGTSGFRQYLSIYFAEIWRTDPAQHRLTSWHNNGGANIQISVEVSANASTPVLRAWGKGEPSNFNGISQLGIIRKMFRTNFATSGTTMELQNILTTLKPDLLASMHFFPNTDATPVYVNQLQVKVAGADHRDSNWTHLLNQVRMIEHNMSPDTGAQPRFDFETDYDDRIDSLLATQNLNSMMVKATLSGTPTAALDVIIQRYGAPE